MASESYDHAFKLLLVGDSGVGKSSILLRFTDNIFDEDIGATIGVDFKVKYSLAQKKRIKLTIWDTAGQERFRTLTSSYYRNAHGIILVYDVSSPQTFANLATWIKEVDMYTSYPDVVKLLVANKADRIPMMSPESVVSNETATEFAREHGMMFISCSAKTREGIQQTFDEVVNKILDKPSLLLSTAPP
eukprot:165090_1